MILVVIKNQEVTIRNITTRPKWWFEAERVNLVMYPKKKRCYFCWSNRWHSHMKHCRHSTGWANPFLLTATLQLRGQWIDFAARRQQNERKLPGNWWMILILISQKHFSVLLYQDWTVSSAVIWRICWICVEKDRGDRDDSELGGSLGRKHLLFFLKGFPDLKA